MALFALFLAAGGAADDGMWLFDHFPKAQVEQKYHVAITDDFLRHLERSSARFNNGGSGSFVSAQGLLFTNHHVGEDCIHQLSSSQHDYLASGFYAVTQQDEKVCPDLEVNILLGTSDVTAQVNQGVRDPTPSAEANRLRKASMARIENDCNKSTGNRCDVVTLYSGGQYSLYQYKKYTEVRLVFAPEYRIAQFGGDPDNFEYPRYCLDFALFRAYENGKPASTPDYLAWSHAGVKDGELALVSGNPASTGRLQTIAQMEFSRDVSYPMILRMHKETIDGLLAFGGASPENKRVAQDYLDEDQNSYKAISGFEDGLRDPSLMDRKRAEERKLRGAIADDPEKQAKFGKLWDEVAAAYRAYAAFFKPYYLLEADPSDSELLAIARRIVRYAEETPKPNDQRLRGYQDSGLRSLEQAMYSTAPLSSALEEAVLAGYFRFLEQELGAGDPTVQAVLAGRTPEQAARAYVSTSKIQDVEERKRLAHSLESVKKSQDGMIRLALILDSPARRYRKEFEDKVEAVIASSASKIAQARFAIYGANEYPDATFTLRLSYGEVTGYHDAQGRPVPYATTFAGLYRRATGEDPFELPPSWIQAKSSLNPDTPFDFVTTADTHGGNSGSPTVNARGEIIGILFDGNREGLPNRYLYTEERARSVHVAANAIIESLRRVYHAGRVLDELGF
ncbi:MAG: S46 family peptidase [Acidobacteriia bacterium]|nr:S46 family peptidase [Terriglobia bacterium]